MRREGGGGKEGREGGGKEGGRRERKEGGRREEEGWEEEEEGGKGGKERKEGSENIIPLPHFLLLWSNLFILRLRSVNVVLSWRAWPMDTPPLLPIWLSLTSSTVSCGECPLRSLPSARPAPSPRLL